MLAKLYSCAIIGLEGGLIEVEVDIAQGLPAFTMTGIQHHHQAEYAPRSATRGRSL
jgi:hypothetical protein